MSSELSAGATTRGVRVGGVASLWRYPIKSFAGERVQTLWVDERGVRYDRGWALVDAEGGIASGKTTRRFRKVPGLLRHQSRLEGEVPVITLVDGRSARAGSPEAQELIDEIAGAGWSLQPERQVSHFDAGAVHIVTSATLELISAAAKAPVPPERLRPNTVLRVDRGSFPEDEWVGRHLRLGSVVLRVSGRTERCVMVNQAQKSMSARRDVLKTIGRLNKASAGIYADVVVAGAITAGDTVHLD